MSETDNLPVVLGDRILLPGLQTRDRIIDLVMRGKLTPAQAEKWAFERGEPAFKVRPGAAQSNPMIEADWSLAMAAGWIIWRTPEAVRDAWAACATECWDWRLFDAVLPRPHEPSGMRRIVGFENKPGDAPTPQSVLRSAGLVGDGLEVQPEDAERELRAALRTGAPLIAYHGEGAREIPARLWKALSPFAVSRRRGAHDAVFNDEGDLRFTNVTVDRDAVLEIWPKIKPIAKGAKRGRKAVKLPRVTSQMLADLHAGCMDRNAKQDALASHYGVSRETCMKALADALSEYELATKTDTKEFSTS